MLKPRDDAHAVLHLFRALHVAASRELAEEANLNRIPVKLQNVRGAGDDNQRPDIAAVKNYVRIWISPVEDVFKGINDDVLGLL